MLAHCHWQQEQTNESLAIYDKLLADYPNNASGYLGRGGLLLETDPTESLIAFAEAMKHAPQESAQRVRNVLFPLTEGHAATIREMVNIVDRGNFVVEAHLHLAFVFAMHGELSNAKREISSAVSRAARSGEGTDGLYSLMLTGLE